MRNDTRGPWHWRVSNFEIFSGSQAEIFYCQLPVRMIPIAISSTEAQLIRKIISKKSKKQKTKSSDHQRLPRKIIRNPVKEKETSKREYQIIYKDEKPETTTEHVERTTEHEERTTEHRERTTEHEERTTENSERTTGWEGITVKPRGPHRGFFNREKFKQILTSNLRTDKDRNKGENWPLPAKQFLDQIILN